MYKLYDDIYIYIERYHSLYDSKRQIVDLKLLHVYSLSRSRSSVIKYRTVLPWLRSDCHIITGCTAA